MKLHYQTVFLSDTHLGCRGAQARDLARFLRAIECRKMYLVGDIVDLWRLKSRWFWPAEHHEVIQLLLGFVRRGVEVIYIPGNHDEAAREFVGLEMCGIKVLENDVHTTADGRNLFVTHGDQYDLVVKHSKLLSLVGSAAYEWLVVINRYYNKWRAFRGLPYWSLSQFLKHKVKQACTFVSRYEESLEKEARHLGLDGVICGHIHKAEAREDGMGYYNCGDWVESCTAVVEDLDGTMRMIEALPEIAELVRRRRAAALSDEVGALAVQPA